MVSVDTFSLIGAYQPSFSMLQYQNDRASTPPLGTHTSAAARPHGLTPEPALDGTIRMRERRIACLTYHKDPGPDWSRDEFIATDIRLPSGQPTTIRLAKRVPS
jgi:hypothetical protein